MKLYYFFALPHILALLCLASSERIEPPTDCAFGTSRDMATTTFGDNTLMEVAKATRCRKVYPTGDKNFAVMQSFPSAISAEEADPFLMCDRFGPKLSKGLASHEDEFPIGWHPHRGQDVVTYLKQGVGRHGDSLGNRETFETPGMQWISVGSGVEHAEGGGTPEGEVESGFQIWINVPSEKKMEPPRYGTEPSDRIPQLKWERGSGRLLAGELDGHTGPFETVQPVLIADIELDPSGTFSRSIPANLDNVIIHVYKGSGRVNGQQVVIHDVLQLDASDASRRRVTVSGASEKEGDALQKQDRKDSRGASVSTTATIGDDERSGISFLLFAGKRLRQPIAWHGPFVMTTQAEIDQTILEYRTGHFLKKRASWNFKKIANRPPALS